jgi:hypothetical protein
MMPTDAFGGPAARRAAFLKEVLRFAMTARLLREAAQYRDQKAQGKWRFSSR